MAAQTVQCPTCFARVPAGDSTCPHCETVLLANDPPHRKESTPPRAVRVPRPSGHHATENDHPRRERRSEPRRRAGSRLLILGGALAALTLLGGAVATVVMLTQPIAAPQAATPTTQLPPDIERPLPQDDDRGEPKRPLPPDDEGKEPKRPLPPDDGGEPNGPAPTFADVVAFELKPAALSADTVEVKLPGRVVDACAAGGGRFLILHFGELKQLAVFDVTQVKVVKYLPLTADTVHIAAGMNKLVVANVEQNTLDRYDLTTFRKEATEKNPFDGSVLRLAMGASSAGPLAVAVPGFGADSKLAFLDPATLKPVAINGGGGWGWQQWSRNGPVRAAPDGSVFTVLGDSPQSFVVRGGGGKWHRLNQNVGPAVPGPDGLLYTADGVYTADFDRHFRMGANGRERHMLPAIGGGMDLELLAAVDKRDGRGREVQDEPGKATAEVRMVGEERVLASFSDIGPLNTHRGVREMPVDRRVYLIPSAEVLVTIPASDDKLVLRRFDLAAELKASGEKFLLVTSRPPVATPGRVYEYRIVARSSDGGVKYKLHTGPVGMAVSDAGILTWAVPGTFIGTEQVLVSITDAAGQETFHGFELAHRDGKPVVGPIGSTGPIAKDRPPAPKTELVIAPSRVFELKPPPQQPDATEVKLSGVVDATCVGGGGRFLVYRIPFAKRLAVLDVVAGKVVKNLPLPESDAPFAAGMTKLFVFNKTANVLQRYDLETFEREAIGLNPLGGEPSVLLMGHASDGPLFVGGRDVGGTKGYGFVNPATLAEWAIPMDWELLPKGKGEFHPLGPMVAAPRFNGQAIGLKVSPDGRTYAWSDYGGKGTVMTIGDRSARVRQTEDTLFQRPTPGPDGTLFGRFGLHSPDLKPLRGKPDPNATFVPATSGTWYLSVVDPDSWGQNGELPRVLREYPKMSVSVGTTADQSTRFPLPSLAGLTGSKSDPLDARLQLIPEANTLAVLATSGNTVHLHRLSVKELVGKADKDFLLVVGGPPPAVRGAKWVYSPQVLAKKGGVKLKLESGSNGMKVDGGTLTWDVPAAHTENEVPVLLTVTDAGGQESFHSFILPVRAAGAEVTVIRPKPPKEEPTGPDMSDRPVKPDKPRENPFNPKPTEPPK